MTGAGTGAATATDDWRLVAWLFLRALGLIYLAAFASLALQVTALAGSQGIYPLAEQLARAAELRGPGRFLAYPSLFWLAAGDGALLAVAWGGAGLALLLALDVGPRWFTRLLLIALYACYLSLFHAGQLFLNFQWDYLLLETGFIAILLPGGTPRVVWLLRLVLFKLRFLSGLAKLLSGDVAWRGLTALEHYFETQPLPHLGAWYAHQLPDWLLRVGTAGTLFVELIVPWCFLLPRPWRLGAALVTILWQMLIIATSNHNFFNLLTIVLCLCLFDDRALARVLPTGWAAWAIGRSPLPVRPHRGVVVATIAAALVLVPAGLITGLEMVTGPLGALSRLVDPLEPWRIANRYHVFPTIETERIALAIAASRDGTTWVPVRLRYAPIDPATAPPFVVPHQPRIDWMTWFVPMNPYFLDWFERFLARVLEGSPAVTAQLAAPPFADGPPGRLRVRVLRLRFTTPAERAASGHWWVTEDMGPFMPLPLMIRDVR